MTFENYKNKQMKITEIIFGIIATVLFILHFFIKETNLIFAYFLVLYAMFCFFASIPIIFNKKANDVFYEKINPEQKVKYIAFAVATGFAISSSLVSISFKIFKWPGSGEMFKMSLFMLVVLLGLSIFFFVKKQKDFFKRVAVRTFIFSLIVSYYLFFS